MFRYLTQDVFRVFLVIVLLMITLQVHAADWVGFATDKSGARHEIDRSSISVEKGLVNVWRKRTPKQVQTLGKYSYSKEITKFTLKCTSPYSIGAVSTTLYDDQGKYVDSYTYNPVDFSEPVPDSIGDVTRKFVCEVAASSLEAKKKDQETEESWLAHVEKFKNFVLDHEGIDYDTNQKWADAWDSEVKRLAHQSENSDKSAQWFLEQAHMNVKKQFAKK